MSKQESTQEVVKRMLFEKGLSGMREIFELPASFSSPLLLAWKRLSLGNYIDGSAVKTIEPMLKDYAQMAADCVYRLDIEQIGEGVEILINNFFIKNKPLVDIKTLDDYYQFIEQLPGSSLESGKDVVGAYVEERVGQLETRLGVLAQHFFAQAGESDVSDLTIYELLEYIIKPVKRDLDSYLDW